MWSNYMAFWFPSKNCVPIRVGSYHTSLLSRSTQMRFFLFIYISGNMWESLMWIRSVYSCGMESQWTLLNMYVVTSLSSLFLMYDFLLMYLTNYVAKGVFFNGVEQVCGFIHQLSLCTGTEQVESDPFNHLTHWGRDKMIAFCRRHFEINFLVWKLYFDSSVPRVQLIIS